MKHSPPSKADLGEHGQIQKQMGKFRLRLRLFPVHIRKIRDHGEGVEGDAHGQDGPGREQAQVFKGRQNCNVQKHRHPYRDGLSGPDLLGQAEIDPGQANQKQEMQRLTGGVKNQAESQ